MVVNDIMYNKRQQQQQQHQLKYRNKCHKFEANDQELIKQPKNEDFYYTLRKYGGKISNTITITSTHTQTQHTNSYCCSTKIITTPLHHKTKRSNVVGVREACLKGACSGLYMWLVLFILMLILCGNTVISQQRIINNNGNNNNNNNIGNILLQISTQTPPAQSTLTNNNSNSNSNKHNNNRNVSVDGRDDGGGGGGVGGGDID